MVCDAVRFPSSADNADWHNIANRRPHLVLVIHRTVLVSNLERTLLTSAAGRD